MRSPAFRPARTVALLLVLVSGRVAAQDSIATEVITWATRPAEPALRALAFDRVWQLVRERYHDPRLNGLDWTQVRERYRPQLDTVTALEGLYSLLSAMVSELGDAHTRVHDPLRTAARRANVAVSTGVSVAPVEGLPTIVAVNDSLRARDPRLAPGLRVVAVDDAAVDRLFALRLPRADRTASAHSTAYLTWMRLLEGPPGATVELRLADTLGAESAVQLERRVIPSRPQVIGRLTDDSVLVLRWDGFRAGIADSVAAWLDRHPHARGVVLDLRMNGGGSAAETGRVIGHFVNERIVIAQVATRQRRWFGLRSGNTQWRAGRADGQRYAGPVVALVSPRSGSGAELLAGTLQEYGRATVVGERSCGCLLGINRYVSLPGGGELAISELGLLSGKLGRRVEGEGVVPDVPVTPTRAAIARGEDEVLRTAVGVLLGGGAAR